LFDEFFFDTKKDGGVYLFAGEFSISKSEPESKQFDSGFFDILRETIAWALSVNTHLGAHVIFSDVVEAIKDTVFDFINDIIDSDTTALIAEVSAAFISCPSGIEGAVMGQDFKGDHFKLVKDIDQDMKDSPR
jgi:hypothetical protein